MSIEYRNAYLTKPEDWDDWYLALRVRSRCLGIQHLIDHPHGTMVRVPPIKHRKRNVDGHSVARSSEEHKSLCSKDERELLRPLWTWIFETVSSDLMWLIEDNNHIGDVLNALERHLAPSDNLRKLTIARQLQQLLNGPDQQEGLIPWFDAWRNTYARAQACHHFFAQGRQGVDMFYSAVRRFNQALSHAQVTRTQGNRSDWNNEFYKALREFREETVLALYTQTSAPTAQTQTRAAQVQTQTQAAQVQTIATHSQTVRPHAQLSGPYAQHHPPQFQAHRRIIQTQAPHVQTISPQVSTHALQVPIQTSQVATHTPQAQTHPPQFQTYASQFRTLSRRAVISDSF